LNVEQLSLAGSAGVLTCHYQPVRQLSGGHLIGHEALVRWVGPDGSALPAGQFITRMARPGRDVVWDVVLGRVGRALAGDGDGWVSVNVDLDQVDQPWVERTLRLLAGSGADLSRLRVEVTEPYLPTSWPQAQHCLGELAGHGIGVLLDDVGAGLDLLRMGWLDHVGVKLDKDLVSAALQHPPAGRLVSAMAEDLAARGVLCIAEGVSDTARRDALVQMGVPAGQGWALGRVGDRLLEA